MRVSTLLLCLALIGCTDVSPEVADLESEIEDLRARLSEAEQAKQQLLLAQPVEAPDPYAEVESRLPESLGTVEAFVAHLKTCRACAVKQYKGAEVEWTFPDLDLVPDGSWYQIVVADVDVNVFPPDYDEQCAPDVTGPATVKGRITSIDPNTIIVSDAEVK